MRLGYFTKLHPSCSAPRFCIESMVALVPTIPRVSPPLSPISTSTPSVPSFKLLWVAPHLISQCIHQCILSSEIMRRLLAACSVHRASWSCCFVEVLLLNICSPSHMILPLESRDLSLLDNYPI
ncbi:unnamed protein product [Musa banksii]